MLLYVQPKIPHPEISGRVAPSKSPRPQNLETRETIYLLHADGLTIPASGTVAVTLTGLRADGSRGTRGTRIELAYQRMRHVGETVELVGERQQALEIVNHRGRPHLPLELGLLHGGRVSSIPDSGSAALHLRLTNVSPDRNITFNDPGTGLASSLVVSFEAQPEGEYRPWALVSQTDGATAALWVEGNSARNWDIYKDELSQHPQWTISPSTQREVLAPGETLQLALGYIYPLTEPGHAPIVVAYHNLPGFQDGFLSVEVERSPITFSGNAVDLGSPLNVTGPLSILYEASVGSYLNVGESLNVDGSLNVGGSLSIGGVELTRQQLIALINHIPTISPI